MIDSRLIVEKLPDLVRLILRNFCHVEWYEVDELAEIIGSDRAEFDVREFEKQLHFLLAMESLPVDEINSLTGNEFGSDNEAREWLVGIDERVFGAKGTRYLSI